MSTTIMMKGTPYVVLPMNVDGEEHSEHDTAKIASEIQTSLRNMNQPQEPERQYTYPLRDMQTRYESIYKYFTWEDSVRTLGSYIGLLSILFSVHYLPVTRVALRAGAITLGVVSITEYISRSFGPNTFLARLRPKEYSKIPESTLNNVLRDIHDLIQYAVVKVQRTLFAQDLDKTFASGLSLAIVYWLLKILSPFWLAVLCLTSFYTATLATSPRSSEVAHNAAVCAELLTNKATNNGVPLVQSGKIKATEMSSKLHESALDAGEHIKKMTQAGKHAALDLSTCVRDSASDILEATMENLTKTSEVSTNAVSNARKYVNSVLDDAKPHADDNPPGQIYGSSDDNRTQSDTEADQNLPASNDAIELDKQAAPENAQDISSPAGQLNLPDSGGVAETAG